MRFQFVQSFKLSKSRWVDDKTYTQKKNSNILDKQKKNWF